MTSAAYLAPHHVVWCPWCLARDSGVTADRAAHARGYTITNYLVPHDDCACHACERVFEAGFWRRARGLEAMARALEDDDE